MKMISKSLFGAAALMSMAGVSQAAIVNAGINWEAADIGQSGETNQFMVTVAADGNDWLYTWTKTGDLDGLGNAADTLSFNLRSSAYTGSSFDGTDLSLGTAFDYSVGGTVTTPADQHFGPDYDLDTNQSFQLSIENIVYTSGDGGPETAVFNGFSAISVYANPAGAQTFYVGTTGAEVLTPSGVDLGFSPVDVLTVTSTVNAKRLRDLDFSFEVAAVPEPSSVALLGIGFGALALRRRRA
ncbi:PEP-CTERM sorting domain-containing protein [Rubritalea spongiae]|uniref:PEP-CTERM sorting domain-containing protein n=1 Tax=Rubritalea spongiae TaxID=430797 RepID=A0ABW5DYK7_9BACT